MASEINYELQQTSFREVVRNSVQQFQEVGRNAINWFKAQPAWKKIIIVLLLGVFGLCGLLFLVYHEYLIQLVVEYSDKWEQSSKTKFILSFLIFLVSFPPLIGFSFLNTIVGCVFGISFKGWFIIAFSSIAGSLCSFLLFKYVLNDKAEMLIRSNKRFNAFSAILRDNNSFWLLALIRLCPLPYSLTNGSLAAIPGITALNFTLGSLISSPKLVLYLFIGSKIKNIGETKNNWERAVDIGSILLTVVALLVTSWVLFTKTQNRLIELEIQRELDLEASNQLIGDYDETEFDIDNDTDNFDVDEDYLTNDNRI